MTKVESLYHTLTGISPSFRYAVLSTIANPHTHIIGGNWQNTKGNGCLFIVATAAALRISAGGVAPDSTFIAGVLGLSTKQVEDGFHKWDSMNGRMRRRLRKQIAEYLAEHYPIITDFSVPAAKVVPTTPRPPTSLQQESVLTALGACVGALAVCAMLVNTI